MANVGRGSRCSSIIVKVLNLLRRPVESAQYASTAYVDMLLQHGMIPSMSRPGNPYDNAKCERLMKTLKQ